MKRIFRMFSGLLLLLVCFVNFGCVDKKAEIAAQQRAEQEKLQEREKMKKGSFKIFNAESHRKRQSGDYTITWESNRNVPLKLDVCDEDGDGITYTAEPTCLDNGHCIYSVHIHVPSGVTAYLTFYNNKNKSVIESSVYTPTLEEMILTEEIFI